MITSPTRPLLKIRSPGDLLEAVPYLIGFHPRESLVLVALRNGVLVVTARLDLADTWRDVALRDVLALLVRSEVTDVLAVVFHDGPTPIAYDDLPWSALAPRLDLACSGAGITLLDAMLVLRGRWWSYLCALADCCPAQGRPVPGPASAAAATATYAGLVALPDRSSIQDMFRPVDGDDLARLAPLLHAAAACSRSSGVTPRSARRAPGTPTRRALTRSLFAAARRVEAPGPVSAATRLSEDEVVRFAVALRDKAVRDSAWIAIDARRLDGRVFWQQLACRVPAPYAAAPLFLYAWCSWRDGNGPVSQVALERALADDPGYHAAELLVAALESGLDPRRTPRLRIPAERA